MNLAYTQGILQGRTTSGSPAYLQRTGNNIAILVDTTNAVPLKAAVIHGDRSYVIEELATVAVAWALPNTTGTWWLYWDIHPVTGAVTRGAINVAPSYGAGAPGSPVTDQLWFNTSTNLMYRWNGSTWVEVIRVFAGTVVSGTVTYYSFATQASGAGTEVATTGGYLVYGPDGVAIRQSTGRFLTTDTTFIAKLGGFSHPMSMDSNVQYAITEEAVSKFAILSSNTVSGEDFKVALADYDEGRAACGWALSAANSGEPVRVVSSGVIYNENWDFDPSDFGKSLYLSTNGTFTLTRQGITPQSVGIVLWAKYVLVDIGVNMFGTAPSIEISDEDFTIYDENDNTKKFQFEIGGFTAPSTHVWTVPNLSDTFVGLTATQTLLNKSFNAITVNGKSTLTGLVGVGNGVDMNVTNTALNIAWTAAAGADASNYGVFAKTVTDNGPTTLHDIFHGEASVLDGTTITDLSAFNAWDITLATAGNVTNVYGFRANNLLGTGGATNTYGFHSNINTGTNRYQFYAAGTAPSYFNGGVQIEGLTSGGVLFGVTNGIVQDAANFSYNDTANRLHVGNQAPSYTNTRVSIAPSATVTSNSASGVTVEGAFPAAATTTGAGYFTSLASTASAYTLTNLVHYHAYQNSRGAGSTITNIRGFWADAQLTAPGAGSVYQGYYSDILFGTNTWQLYMNGTASSYFGGCVGLFETLPAANSAGLYIGTVPSTLVNAATSYVIRVNSTAPTGATTGFHGTSVRISTIDSAVTYSAVNLFTANQVVRGASSSISNVRGFYASNNIAQGGTNSGFYSDISLASNTYQLYMAGTGASRFSGPVSIRTTPLSHQALSVSVTGIGQSSGSTHGLSLSGQFDTAATACIGFQTGGLTTGASSTVNTLTHYLAGATTLGSSSTVTTVYGYRVSDSVKPASFTSVIGYYSDINTATGVYQLYMSGTAPSRFNGPVEFNSSLSFPSITQGSILFAGNSGLVAQDNTNLFWDDTNNRMGLGANASLDARLVVTIDSLAASGGVVRGIRLSGTGASGAGSVYGMTSALTTNGGVSPAYDHFEASSTTRGGASTGISTSGFVARTSLTPASNYTFVSGFKSDIARNTNVWQAWMGGTANSYFGGPIGILSGAEQPFENASALFISGTHPSAATTVYGTRIDITGAATATSEVHGYSSIVRTSASAYTLTSGTLFYAADIVLGAGSTMTNGYGFRVSNSIASATNNYGFYSDIANATTTWQLYMAGTAPSYFAGSVGIGGGPTATSMAFMGRTTSAMNSTVQTVFYADPSFSSATTSSASVFRSIATTAAASFTLTELNHFYVQGATKGAGSTITNVYGYRVVNSAFNQGTNNYAFHSDLVSGSNIWQGYFGGTAHSHFGGPVNLLSTNGATDVLLRLGSSSSTHPSTTATTFGTYMDLACNTSVTTNFTAHSTILRTPNSAFTLTAMYGYRAQAWSRGAASTVTLAAAFVAENGIAVGTTNYGFYSTINSASNTYQLYMGGTAASYFNADVTVNSWSKSNSIREATANPTIAANALAIDCSIGYSYVSLNANVNVLSLNNPPPAGTATTITVEFTADGTQRTITWPASVKWSYGIAPTMTATSGKIDLVQLTTRDGGTTWLATITQAL